MSTLNSTLLTPTASGDNRLVAGAVGVAAIIATTTVYYALRSRDDDHGFPKLRGVQLHHAWNFFQRRYDFLQSNFKRNLGKCFCFNVLHHTVIALAGEDARRVFFSDRHLDFNEGYRILMGAVRISFLSPVTERPIDLDNLRRRGSAMWTLRLRRARMGTLLSSTKSYINS